MAFSLNVPARVLKKELQDAQAKIRVAGVRALNKTATQGRNIAQRKIREKINVKAATIKKVLSIKRASRNRINSAIRASYKQLPVIDYNGVRQTKRGVSVRMRKDFPRMVFKHAFIATMKSGHKGVFRRRYKKDIDKRRHGLPIDELLGPNPQVIFAENIDTVMRDSNAIFDRVYNHELNFIFRK